MAKFEGNLGTHLLLLLVAVIWGSTWAVGRFLSYGLDESTRANLGPATAAWLRYTVAVIAFVAWCWAYRNRNGPRLLPHDSQSGATPSGSDCSERWHTNFSSCME